MEWKRGPRAIGRAAFCKRLLCGFFGAADLCVLRLLRLLRMLKLVRRPGSFGLLFAARREKCPSISALLFVLLLTVTIAGSLTFMIMTERTPGLFLHLNPTAMWWAIETQTTVGHRRHRLDRGHRHARALRPDHSGRSRLAQGLSRAARRAAGRRCRKVGRERAEPCDHRYKTPGRVGTAFRHLSALWRGNHNSVAREISSESLRA